MKTVNLKIFLLGILGLLLPARELYSQSLSWEWNYTSTLFSGSGTFTTDTGTLFEHELTGHLITDITGSFNGEPITALLPPVTLGGNDNLVADTIPQIDQNGISFSTPTDDFHFFYTDLDGYGAYGNTSPYDGGHSVFTAQIVSTPEPATTVVITVGALAFVAFHRGRTARQARF